MQRRTFMKYSAITGTTMVFPQLATSNEFTKMMKAAWYCSKLNPVRFIAGLVFDEIAEVFLKPLIKSAFNDFTSGRSVSKSSLTYYTSSSVKEATKIEHEPYKASVVIYGVADYELYKQRELNLQLKRQYDKERFIKIRDYLKSEKAELQLYTHNTPIDVGDSLEPNDLFNVEQITFRKPHKEHYLNLLEETENRVFQKLIV